LKTIKSCSSKETIKTAIIYLNKLLAIFYFKPILFYLNLYPCTFNYCLFRLTVCACHPLHGHCKTLSNLIAMRVRVWKTGKFTVFVLWPACCRFASKRTKYAILFKSCSVHVDKICHAQYLKHITPAIHNSIQTISMQLHSTMNLQISSRSSKCKHFLETQCLVVDNIPKAAYFYI
jgi:hypothetical protein